MNLSSYIEFRVPSSENKDFDETLLTVDATAYFAQLAS